MTGGTGLIAQPGLINLDIPAGATVNQVLLYWEGQHRIQPAGDATIVVNGNDITGSLIGGPTIFFGGDVKSSSFRADITALGLVTAGANALNVSGLTNDFANNGAGIVVIIDDGSADADIQVRDGNDLVYGNFKGALQTTVPQTFTVEAGNADRSATLSLNVSSVEPNRPNVIKVTIGAVVSTMADALGSGDGHEWDTLDIPLTVPAGVTTVTVELISVPGNTTPLPASMAWVSTTLATESPIDPCGVPSATPAVTHGSAYSLDATLLGGHVINKAGAVATVAPGAPANQARQLGSLSVPTLVSAGLLNTQSNSSLNPSTSTASATIANVSLLGGLVKATTIRGVSQSVASTGAASYNSSGSTIQGLTINNSAVPVVPNSTVSVRNPLIPSQIVAELSIYKESGTSTYAGDVSSASHSVTMLELVVLRPFLGLAAGATVSIGHAQTDAQGPTIGCPGLKSVSGEAFTTYVNGQLGGQQLANLKVGAALLPSTGGDDSDSTNASLPGIATSTSASNTTSGSLQPNPNATARSIIEGAKVLGTVVTADLIDVSSTSSADGTTAGTTFVTTFVNLKVGGSNVNANVAPNTQMTVTLGGGISVSVVLNERTVNSNGTTDTSGTVNAVHARVFLGGVLQGEIIVGSAHSDAHA